MNDPLVQKFDRDLLDEDRCREWFLLWLYGSSICCPRCGHPLKKQRVPRFFQGKISYCSHCGKKFYPLRGSPFHSSKLDYQELAAILLLWGLGVTPDVIAALLKRQKVAISGAVKKIEALKRMDRCTF